MISSRFRKQFIIIVDIPIPQSLLKVTRWPYSAPRSKKGITCDQEIEGSLNACSIKLERFLRVLCKENLVITLRVMDGSPENNSLVFEIARFAAGSINLPTLKMSSSVSLNFLSFSTLFLWLHYQNLNTQNPN